MEILRWFFACFYAGMGVEWQAAIFHMNVA
jgi:hypothetical protein